MRRVQSPLFGITAKIQGIENYPDGPFVMVCNHQSSLDCIGNIFLSQRPYLINLFACLPWSKDKVVLEPRVSLDFTINDNKKVQQKPYYFSIKKHCLISLDHLAPLMTFDLISLINPHLILPKDYLCYVWKKMIQK